MDMKICATCGKEKNKQDYHRDIRMSDGLRNVCKECTTFNPKYQEHIQSIKQKMCNYCKVTKLLEEFVRDERRTLGYGMQCLDCSQLKLCRTCQQKKYITAFRRSDRSKDGYGYRCKDCENKIRRDKYNDKTSSFKETKLRSNQRYQYKKSTKEGNRERMLLKNYKLTLEQYDELLEKQNGVCKICKQTRGRTYLVVDHDHKCCPGKESCGKCIRGLLCDPCNQGIGCLLEDAQIMTRAIEYISMSAHFG